MPDAPEYTGPSEDYNAYIQQLLALYPGLQDRLNELWGTVQGNEPVPYLSTLPYSPEQMFGYGTRLMTGQRAGRLGEELESDLIGNVNRTYRNMYDTERQKAADTGQRKSSYAARSMAEGKQGLIESRTGARTQAREYEEQIRNLDFGKGMNILGGLESAYRGDEAATSNFLNKLMTLFGLESGVTAGQAGALTTGIGAETSQQQMLNNFLLNLFGIEEGVGGGGGGFNPMDLLYLAPLLATGGAGGAPASCFLTTACVEHMGLPDDCFELETLRQFRDEYVANLPEGKEMIAEYYEHAPRIVEGIKTSTDPESILDKMWSDIKRAVSLIVKGDLDGAFKLYADIFTGLKAEFA